MFVLIYCLVEHNENFVLGFRAVFGYDGKTNDLKVVETGGELEMIFTEVIVVRLLFAFLDAQQYSSGVIK